MFTTGYLWPRGRNHSFSFLVVISLGAFLIINLVLAVVATNYESANDGRPEEGKAEESPSPCLLTTKVNSKKK